MPNWTPRVAAQKDLAVALLAKLERARAAGLREEDLRVLADQGAIAEAADRQQVEELTTHRVPMGARREQLGELAEEERRLRDVVTAVVDDLEATEPALAQFLARLSFARFRVRELKDAGAAATDDGAGENAEVRSVTLVEREDRLSRTMALGRFCHALLQPGREAIVAAFDARGMTDLAGLAARAEALAAEGPNVMRAAASTAREAAAVAAQTKKWKAVRRLVRRAVEGDPDLQPKLALC
jgi:hypothetical protein